MNRRRNQKKWISEDIVGGYGKEGKYFNVPKYGSNLRHEPSREKSKQHDDRVESTRRVSFKPNNNRISKRERHSDRRFPVHARLDEDVEMAGTSGLTGRNPNRFSAYEARGGRGGWYGRNKRQGRNSPAPRSKLSDSASWFKVTIPYGAKYEKEYILRLLISHISPTLFIPIAYRTQGNEATFYVEDFEAAQKLSAADRRMTSNDGFKIQIRVQPGLPKFDLNPTLKTKVTEVMGKRYNLETKALDLTKFHLDPDLVQDSFCALSRTNLMIAVIDIISENIPDMVALNLSENKIHSIDHLSALSKKTPNLKILHLGKNKIHDVQQLNSLQGLPIVELMLQGNPLCNKFKEQSLYVSSRENIFWPNFFGVVAKVISRPIAEVRYFNFCPGWEKAQVLCSLNVVLSIEVRKRFPKLIKLDGMDLPPQISFDVTDETCIPSSKGCFFCAPEGQPIVRQFLEQYYSLYDADNRQPLLDAYHQNALFSLTSAYPAGQGAVTTYRLNDYLVESRNLIKVPDFVRRQKLLRQGKLCIVTFLSQLPTTQHDPLSFAVDLPIFNPRLICISVSGVFRETKTVKQPIRAFNRVFVIVPAGSGFCIVNEQLFVTNPTRDQERAAFKSSQVVPVPSEPQATPSAPLSDEAMQLQMVQTMSLQSGMNVDWSRKCLAETQWNFERALFVFTELHKQGTIPAEAFIK